MILSIDKGARGYKVQNQHRYHVIIIKKTVVVIALLVFKRYETRYISNWSYFIVHCLPQFSEGYSENLPTVSSFEQWWNNKIDSSTKVLHLLISFFFLIHIWI